MNLPLKIALGLIGGFSATAPMTTVMLTLHRLLPPRKQYPLPPREIAMQLATPSEAEASTLWTLASHFGYGSRLCRRDA